MNIPLSDLIEAAQGKAPADLCLKDVSYLDVFSCEWRQGDVFASKGYIVGIEPGLKARRTIDARGKYVVPGFIDAHVHVESSMLLPDEFERVVLPKGTTSAICDPHELTNVMGVKGLEFFLETAQSLKLDLRVMLSSCVPATDFETNGAGRLKAPALLPFASHPKALGLAEMMNVPGVLASDPEVLEKLEAFQNRIIDGHCPTLSGLALSAYAASGISSCHESTRLEEAQEKLTKGIACWIREGSVAKDLGALAPLLSLATSTSVGFCTDDRNPLDIAREGHIDHLVRGAIALGVSPTVAYRSASWTVARHYRLQRQGAIAPGYQADFILLDDPASVHIGEVFKGGVSVKDLVSSARKIPEARNTVRAAIPDVRDLAGPTGNVHVIGVHSGRILTSREVAKHDAPGIARLSVLERYGKGSKPANGYVRGFGNSFRGAIASSVGHDSHNLIVVGTDPKDMRTALAVLAECGGGFCCVQDGKTLARLALGFGGLMSMESAETVEKALWALRKASRDLGCELPEPFLQLAFLSLPVIPSLKLTDKGLVDVDAFKIIDVRAA